MSRRTHPRALKIPVSLTLEKRIRERVEENPFSECWEWVGYRTADGYGQIRVGEKILYIHRVAFALWVGDIRRGQDVHHKCNCRWCCNPDHLQAVGLTINRSRKEDDKCLAYI